MGSAIGTHTVDSDDIMTNLAIIQRENILSVVLRRVVINTL